MLDGGRRPARPRSQTVIPCHARARLFACLQDPALRLRPRVWNQGDGRVRFIVLRERGDVEAEATAAAATAAARAAAAATAAAAADRAAGAAAANGAPA